MPMGIRVMPWGPLPKRAPYCYARESEMARCFTKTMLARGPAGVTVRACLDFGPGPNSCCMPRAPIILNPALGIWYWPKFNVGPMLSQRWHDNVGTTLDQRWPNSGPTLAQRWPNSGPALAHMNVLKLWCDGRKDKFENVFQKMLSSDPVETLDSNTGACDCQPSTIIGAKITNWNVTSW